MEIPAAKYFEIEPREVSFSFWEVNLELSEYIPYFQGHFPGNPILPGFAVVEGSLKWINRISPETRRKTIVIKKAKFLRPIKPLMKIRCQLLREPVGRWVTTWFVMSGDTEERAAELVMHFE